MELGTRNALAVIIDTPDDWSAAYHERHENYSPLIERHMTGEQRARLHDIIGQLTVLSGETRLLLDLHIERLPKGSFFGDEGYFEGAA
jgi:hypothetical protein